MGFNPDIKKAVNRLANKKVDELREIEIYNSREMKKYLSGLSGTLIGDHRKALDVEVTSEGKNGPTACTNGDKIKINWQNEIFSRYSSPESRFSAFLGGFYHEMSHVLFYDFDSFKTAKRTLAAGYFYGDEPIPRNTEEEKSLAELKHALKRPEYSKFMAKIYDDLDNIIGDRHDEDAMIDMFGGLVKSGIFKIRESLSSYLCPFEEHIDDIRNGKMKRLSAAYDAVLQLSRFGTVFMYNDGLWHSSEILQSIKDCVTDIEDAVCEDVLWNRFTLINRIVLRLWPYIREILEQSDPEGNGQGDCGADNVMSALGDGCQVPQSVPAQGRNGSGMPSGISSAKSSQCSNTAFGNPVPDDNVANSVLDGLKKDVAKSLAEDEVEQEVANNLLQKVSTENMCIGHAGVPLDFRRDLRQRNPERCQEITEAIRPYTKKLVSEVKKALKDIQEGGTAKHKPFGRILVPNDAYRPDGLYFARKKLPQDLPDMAISILVDNSGSMDGLRLATAREAAMLVYDFATELRITVQVSGHTTDGNKVIYQVFADFERVSSKDREGIAAMRAKNCNRDGMALEIAGKLLESRPERYKLLIIISDGQPNHFGYGGDEAAEDIRTIVKRLRHKGIELIAAAIGDDKEMISGIYGESFLDISSLDKLPKTMAKIIRERIMRQIA